MQGCRVEKKKDFSSIISVIFWNNGWFVTKYKIGKDCACIAERMLREARENDTE